MFAILLVRAVHIILKWSTDYDTAHTRTKAFIDSFLLPLPFHFNEFDLMCEVAVMHAEHAISFSIFGHNFQFVIHYPVLF